MELAGYHGFKLVGAGGNAHVYRAVRDTDSAEVAIKILRGGGDDAVNRRFERERKLMHELDTIDNVVPVYESGTTGGGDPFLVMPLYTGGSLQQQVQDGRFEWHDAVTVTRKIASALSMAHAKRILHLDLKPANVLLDEAGKPWLADFGIAEMMGSTASMSAAMMTPAFTPPERLNGEKPSEQTDIYGAGALLFALLAGEAPFTDTERTSPMAVMMAVVNEPIPVDRLDPDTPQSVINLVLRTMSKDVRDRPKSAIELVGLLDDLLEGREVLPPETMIDTNLRPDPEDLAVPLVLAGEEDDLLVAAGGSALDTSGPMATSDSGLAGGGLADSGMTQMAAPLFKATQTSEAIVSSNEEDEDNRKPVVWLVAAAIFLLVGGLGVIGALVLGGDGNDAGIDQIATSDTLDTSDVDPNADEDLDIGESAATENDGEIVTEVQGKQLDATPDGDSADGDPDGDDSDATDGVTDSGEPSISSSTAAPDKNAEKTAPTTAPTTTIAATTSTRRATTTTATTTSTTTSTSTTAAPIPAPRASFTANKTTITEGDTVSFTNTSTGDVSSTRWKFGDGGTSSSSNTSHKYNSSGTYTVELTTTGPGGTDKATRTIKVNKAITLPVFSGRVDIGAVGENNIAFRFTSSITVGYTARVKAGSTTVGSSSGTASANQRVNVTIGGLDAGKDYTIEVTLNGVVSVTSPPVSFRTSGGTPVTIYVPVAVQNLRLVNTQSTRFEINYESNICANGSFVIREQGGPVVGSNSGQASGCTTRHLGIPGFWTPALKPNTTYVITVTVEAGGAGQGGGNTASKSLTVTTS